MAGYSGKPLYQKLGFKPGWSVAALEAPPQYSDLLTGIEDVQIDTALRGGHDAVHLFLHAPDGIAEKAAQAIEALAPGGMLWLSWPKKSSKLFNGTTEDMLRRDVLPLGWVDVKVCAVDADWSGLKFLKRRSDPPQR